MTVAQIKKELQKRGCPQRGNKAELIRKLLLTEQKTMSTLRRYVRELGCTGTRKMNRSQLLRILAEHKCPESKRPERKQQIRQALLQSTTLPNDTINIIAGMTGDCRADVLEKRFRQLLDDLAYLREPGCVIFTFLETQPGVQVFSESKYLPLQKDEVIVALDKWHVVSSHPWEEDDTQIEERYKITVFHTYASLLDYYSTEKDWVYDDADMPVPVANDRRTLRTRTNELKRCLRKLPHLEKDILIVPCHVLETILDKNELIDLYQKDRQRGMYKRCYPADDLYYTDYVSLFEDYQPESPTYQPESPTYSPI